MSFDGPIDPTNYGAYSAASGDDFLSAGASLRHVRQLPLATGVSVNLVGGGAKSSRLLFAVALIFLSAAASAQSLMQFQAFPPNPISAAFMGAHGWVIYASGEIDNEAYLRLEDLMLRKKIPIGSYIYLHSPGGSMTGGIKLGKMIRKYFLITDVGELNRGDTQWHGSNPGECYSACAMAFLGGEYRFLRQGSVYGVHRFFWEERTEHDADLAQMMSAVVVEYIRSMDVNTDIFTLASQAGRNEVVSPPRSELEQLKVINNGTKETKWTIESQPTGLYLKGERETWNGINKFMIVCPARGQVALYIIFDPGANADEVMKFGAETLMVDQTAISLQGRRTGKQLLNGWINLVYALDRQMLNRIGMANTVGILLQPTREAAFYAGFDLMPFEEGRKKLPGLLQACRAAASLR